MDKKLDAQVVMKQFRQAAEAALQSTIVEAHARIVDRTPVDTGRARANWHVVANDPDPPVTTETDPDGSAAKARAAADAREIKLGDVAYISNGVPYIELLEHGSSQQAPNGMLALARQETPGIFQREFRKVAKS